ncbi:hypothetical protein EMIHUDRAFT_102676 [Emiliania huxleyi CCMP1516]|uniref:Uncharacterized protein n=2 Tax=Emiliania huxleyi TaxID=2903 RepID=A0A0D3J1R6_EMIH1|nr:hypothetical protein EMIHUDRAFT_102676 [Emiliania huxleyi CCMP1516]EOD17451.1 hypothetical protein EMIHUDRAFT_102676 [Emiliania huxleyi CCMP1516]|eukprot:XP_005769880.1 hypothetical protein EMIHUDRAFT_102676 [Emiliania huxleyi CCMP1516]
MASPISASKETAGEHRPNPNSFALLTTADEEKTEEKDAPQADMKTEEPPVPPSPRPSSLNTVESFSLGFQGGYVTDAHAYYVPFYNGAYSGYAARVNLSDFSSSGVEYFNLADTNPNLKGFFGGFATDAHAYYVPTLNDGGRSGYAARVSLSDFSSSGVEYLNLADTNSNLKGFQGGYVTDTHAYYVPYSNGAAYSGYAARVSLSDFSSSGVEYLNLADTNPNLKGFFGGFATDAHAYYLPNKNDGGRNGYAARVSLSDFSNSGVEYLNLADTNSNLKGFNGGFATDAHAYFVPDKNGSPHGYAARVNLSDFSSSGVEYLNLADTNSNLRGFGRGFATDAHAYYAPWDYGARSGYAARVSLSDFSSSGVEYLNLADTNSNLKGAGAALLATNLLPAPLAALRSDAIVHETETADTIMGEVQKDSAEGSTAAAGGESPVTLKSIMAELAVFKSDMQKKEQEVQKKDEAFKEEMKKKDEAFKEEMTKKDEMIAELLAALKSKTDHKQVQTSAGGEVVELVSAADHKALEARVQAAEERVEECVAQNAAQDAKIGALRDKPAPPNPPAAAARPPAAARRQLSSATGDETEFAITGRKATLSFNSRTPDLTATRLTGEGGGKLTGYAARVNLSDFSSSGVEYFNLADTNPNLKGFFGGFATDAHAYYVPTLNDGGRSGYAARVSLSDFSSSGVEYLNLADTNSNLKGFQGGYVTDTHAYYVPYSNGAAYSGYAARVSLSDFSSSGVEYLNLADTNPNLKGFFGGFATDAHAYYLPNKNDGGRNGYAARVSLSDFSNSGVEYLNLADTNSNLKGFNGGFATDAHAYFVPDKNGSPHGYAARVNLSDFSSSGVEYLNLADTNSNLRGFGRGFATDAHAYYAPWDYGARSGYAARVSLSDFSSSGVEYLNLADTNSNLKGLNGGFATATHAYYVPYHNGGAFHGYAARVSLLV